MTCKVCGKNYEVKPWLKAGFCNGCRQKIVSTRNKFRAVEHLGGKCERCGYDNPLALTFHHKDPTIKEYGPGNIMNKSWDAVRIEIEKCELLCSNCHIIEHTEREDVIAYLSTLD